MISKFLIKKLLILNAIFLFSASAFANNCLDLFSDSTLKAESAVTSAKYTALEEGTHPQKLRLLEFIDTLWETNYVRDVDGESLYAELLADKNLFTPYPNETKNRLGTNAEKYEIIEADVIVNNITTLGGEYGIEVIVVAKNGTSFKLIDSGRFGAVGLYELTDGNAGPLIADYKNSALE